MGRLLASQEATTVRALLLSGVAAAPLPGEGPVGAVPVRAPLALDRPACTDFADRVRQHLA
ncbi:MAG: hypothetical protein ABIW57_00650 [Polyangia bacterium]